MSGVHQSLEEGLRADAPSLVWRGLCARGSFGLKGCIGYWLMRKDGGLGGRENDRDSGTSRRVWAGAAPRESVKSRAEGWGGKLASGYRRPASFLRPRVETDTFCLGSSAAASRPRCFVSMWPCCQAREQWAGHEGPLA